MYEKESDRTLKTIAVTVGEFQERLHQFKSVNNSSQYSPEDVSVYSHLALIHQVAKAYALEVLTKLVGHPTELAIEEITNPPLHDQENNDEPVVIQFSYCD